MTTAENSSTNGSSEPRKATEYETVRMTDGREVQFAGAADAPRRRKMLKESFYNADGTLDFVRFDFRNGETRTWTPPPSLLGRLAGHGAEQKIGDETAGEEDVDDMVIAVDSLINRLDKGEWNIKREGVSGTSVLIRALMELSGNSVEVVKKFLENKTQADKLALRNSPKLKPIVERIESEKAAKTAHVDVDALLAGLPSAEGAQAN